MIITLFVMILSGFMELMVINSVVPFLAAITNPEILYDLEITKNFYKSFWYKSKLREHLSLHITFYCKYNFIDIFKNINCMAYK